MQKYVYPMVTNYVLVKDKALYKQRRGSENGGQQWNDVAYTNGKQTQPRSSQGRQHL